MHAWLTAFIFTQLVEIPIYTVATGCRVIVAFGASAITHPIVWFVICGVHWHSDYLVQVVAAELFAWLAEAAYFAFIFGKRRAWLWSLCANGASLSLGLLSRHWFGVP